MTKATAKQNKTKTKTKATKRKYQKESKIFHIFTFSLLALVL